jgi:hypothetical protein
MSQNTKCLACLATFTNSYNLSFCGSCGADPQYLVEYQTDTERTIPTQNELLIARLDALIAELELAKQNLKDLAELVGIDLTSAPSGDN